MDCTSPLPPQGKPGQEIYNVEHFYTRRPFPYGRDVNSHERSCDAARMGVREDGMTVASLLVGRCSNRGANTNTTSAIPPAYAGGIRALSGRAYRGDSHEDCAKAVATCDFCDRVNHLYDQRRGGCFLVAFHRAAYRAVAQGTKGRMVIQLRDGLLSC